MTFLTNQQAEQFLSGWEKTDMNLYDAAAARDIADAIDAALAAFRPRGMDINALNRVYAELVRASGMAKELYARTVEAHPIIAIEKDEPQTQQKPEESPEQQAEKETEKETGKENKEEKAEEE